MTGIEEAAALAIVEAGFAETTAGALAFIGFAESLVASTALSYAMGEIFKPSVPGFEAQTVQQLVKAPTVSRKAVYGEMMTSGAVVFHKVKTEVHDFAATVEYLHLVVVLATHECESIGEIFLDDKTQFDPRFYTQIIDDSPHVEIEMLKINKHLGGVGQVADPDLVAAFPDEWTAAHTLDGVTYVYMKLAWLSRPIHGGTAGWEASAGQTLWQHVPNIRAIVQGKKVLDPRNLALPATWSDNWARCVYDYMTDRTFGVSRAHDISGAIDLAVAGAAVTTSDELVTLFATWNAATAYVVGDRVGTTSGMVFKAVVNNTNVAPPLTTYWLPTTQQAQKPNYRPWDIAAPYYSAVGVGRPADLVEFGGITYSALMPSVGNQPDLFPLVWQPEPTKPAFTLLHPLWDIATAYLKNQLVVSGTTVFKAFIDNTGQDPANTDVSTWLPLPDRSLTQKRYTLNGIVDTATAPGTVVANMRTAGAGNVSPSGSFYKISAGAYSPAVYSITESDLRGPVTIRPHADRKSLFNAVKGIFVDPANKWQTTDFPLVHNSFYQAEDAGGTYVGVYDVTATYSKDQAVDTASNKTDAIVWMSKVGGNTGNPLQEGAFWHEIKPIVREIQLRYTTDVMAAQRIAKIVLEKSRQAMVIDLPLNWSGFPLTTLDAITVNIAQANFTNKIFRVANWALDPAGGVSITAHEDASTTYDWNFGEPTLYDPNPNQPRAPADVTGLTIVESMQLAGAVTSVVTVTWTPPGDPVYASANVYYRALGSTQWLFGGSAISTIQATVMITGTTYQVQVNAVAADGMISATGPIGQITLDGGTIAAIQTPISPVLRLTLDVTRNVTGAQVQFQFDPAIVGPNPDGGALMWQVMPNRNALPCGTDNGSSIDVAAVDVLDYIQGIATVQAGSTVSTIIVPMTIVNVPGLVGQWWLRVTDNAANTSQWRKALWVDANSVQLSSPLDIAPVAGWSVDVAMIAWVDDRINPEARLLYSQGEVFSWGALTENAGAFTLTGLQRGLEGTPQAVLTGQLADYYPAPGGNTNMLLIPKADVTITGTTITWDGAIPGLNIPVGSYGSATFALYKMIQNGHILRSNIVPFRVVAG